MKLAVTETLFEVWLYRNGVIFEKKNNTNIVDIITEKIMYRGWMSKHLREHIGKLKM